MMNLQIPPQVFSGSSTASVASTTVSLHLDSAKGSGLATITLAGPSGSWFAWSFGSPNFAMADKPYTIVVDGK